MRVVPKIVVVGTGQIGTRHLQSLAKADWAKELWAIDSRRDAAVLLETRLAEVAVGELTPVKFSTNMDSLPRLIDVAIIATDSMSRLQVLDELLASYEIKFVILEKFLFPRFKEYHHAEKRLAEKSVTAFVNCPRRVFAAYRAIKQEVKAPLHLQVTGSNWGLACNSVHWLDLLNFFVPSDDYKKSSELLGPYQAKRNGYVEFFGSIEITDSSGNHVVLTCVNGNSLQFSINIEDALGRSWQVSEQLGQIMIDGCCKQFHLPPQSELTAGIVQKLLDEQECSLTPFGTAARLHQILLDEFLAKYNAATGLHQNDMCPIT
nr:oxidoreductase family, NAD-binding Rossmann fold protein [uncultured bacterium]